MYNLISTYGSILFLLIAFYFTARKEGWRERERQVFQSGDWWSYKRCQAKWHTAGFWQRLFMGLALIIQTLPDYRQMIMWGLVVLWFAWVGYDGWTNMPKDLSSVPGIKRWYQRFFYSGSTQTGSKIDRALGEYLPFIKLFYTILLPVFITIYLTVRGF
jgi:hypothetical protein